MGAAVVGGAVVGLAGAAFSLDVKLGWRDGLTENFGWIALAIVIFGGWNPVRAALGCYLFGGLQWAGLSNWSEPIAEGGISHGANAFFQLTFAIITPALISGAVVERMNFRAWLAFLILWSTVIYLPLAHMVWGPGGFLGAGGLGAIDPNLVTATGGRIGPAMWGVIVGELGIGLGYPGMPHVVTRYMATRSDGDVQRLQIIAMLWGVAVFYGAGLVGLVLPPGHDDRVGRRLERLGRRLGMDCVPGRLAEHRLTGLGPLLQALREVHGVADDGGLVGLGALRVDAAVAHLVAAALEGLLGVVPSATGVGHEDGQQNAAHRHAGEQAAEHLEIVLQRLGHAGVLDLERQVVRAGDFEVGGTALHQHGAGAQVLDDRRGGREGQRRAGLCGRLRRNGLDIVLVFDSTGSMGGEIEEVKRLL
mgnify:CR=1 FL=1